MIMIYVYGAATAGGDASISIGRLTRNNEPQ